MLLIAFAKSKPVALDVTIMVTVFDVMIMKVGGKREYYYGNGYELYVLHERDFK